VKPLLDWRVAAVVLTVVGWVVYAPALDRVFAADQIWYFAEVGDSTLSAGLRHLDYNVSRVYWKGDELLFRPVTFAWLALANWAFSYHHVWWNLANLAIHIAVALAVFRLLIAIQPSPLALPASVLFLVFEPSMELVVWNHLGGYMLAWCGLAVGLRAFVRMLGGGTLSEHRRDVVTFAVAFTLGSLAYEPIVPITTAAVLLLFAHHWHRVRWREGALLVAPVLTFVLLYAGHALQAPRLTFVDSSVSDRFGLGMAVDVVWGSLLLVAAWTRELLLPTALQLGGLPAERFWKSFEPSWTEPVLILNIVVVLATLSLVAMSMAGARARRVTPLLALLAFAIVVYPAIIAFGRREAWVVATTYYAYPFGLLGVVVSYTLVDRERLVAWRRPALAGLVWVFAGIHALGTWNTAWEVEWTTREHAAFFARVGAFVDAHRSEPGFSFSIDEHSEEIDPPIALLVGYPDDPAADMQFRRMSEVLFAPYYNGVTPRYVLNATAEAVSAPYTAR
jgi:hypothetical protein